MRPRSQHVHRSRRSSHLPGNVRNRLRLKIIEADGPAVIELNIHPAKLSDPKVATESEGTLFWKITTGKKPMPAFGKRFSETDRWNLVNYIRTLPKR